MDRLRVQKGSFAVVAHPVTGGVLITVERTPEGRMADWSFCSIFLTPEEAAKLCSYLVDAVDGVSAGLFREEV